MGKVIVIDDLVQDIVAKLHERPDQVLILSQGLEDWVIQRRQEELNRMEGDYGE